MQRHLAALALLGASSSWAAIQVQVVGLFPGAAVVNVDGQFVILLRGEKALSL